MRRIEATEDGAPFVVLNIYLDDHYRNLDAYRLLRLGRWWRDYDRSLATSMFHANPWEHVRIDPGTGSLVVRPSACPTPESLYDLCDTDFLLHHFADDFVARKLIGDGSGRYDHLPEYRDLAEHLGIEFDPGRAPAETAHELWEQAAFESTRLILVDLQRELRAAGKDLLVLLTYPAETVNRFLKDGSRPDAAVLRSLGDLGIRYVDGLRLHAADYEDFRATPEAYTSRYYAGHYTPLGNAQYAFMIKPALVEWLEPAPPAYAASDASFAVQAGRLA
jgi:hypothetical protein